LSAFAFRLLRGVQINPRRPRQHSLARALAGRLQAQVRLFLWFGFSLRISVITPVVLWLNSQQT
jgi:hypothetical protein